jgi:hypothetical protein
MTLLAIRGALLSFVAAACASGAHAQLLAHDGFGNGPLANLDGSTGGAGWTTPWIDVGTDPTAVQGVGLSYPGLDTTPGAAITPVATGTWPSTIYQRAFSPPPAGTRSVFVAFLLRDDAGQGMWGGLSFGQYPYEMTVGSPLGMYTFGLMTSHGIGNLTNRRLVLGQTVLVVVEIRSNAPAPGVTYRMFLDPVIGAPQPASAAATFALTQVSALPSGLALDNGTGFTTDELRVGTTWAAVLPAQPNSWRDLGFAKPGVNGAPQLSGSGTLQANTPCGVTLTNGSPSSLGLLILGTQVLNAPFLGGVLVPDVAAAVPLATDAAGAATLVALWPAGIPPGLHLSCQLWIADFAATFGISASNGLQGTSR